MNCECVEKLNASENMKANNSHIQTATMINFKTGKCREVLNLPLTRSLSKGPKMKAKFITASFCPFCGTSQSIEDARHDP